MSESEQVNVDITKDTDSTYEYLLHETEKVLHSISLMKTSPVSSKQEKASFLDSPKRLPTSISQPLLNSKMERTQSQRSAKDSITTERPSVAVIVKSMEKNLKSSKSYQQTISSPQLLKTSSSSNVSDIRRQFERTNSSNLSPQHYEIPEKIRCNNFYSSHQQELLNQVNDLVEAVSPKKMDSGGDPSTNYQNQMSIRVPNISIPDHAPTPPTTLASGSDASSSPRKRAARFTVLLDLNALIVELEIEKLKLENETELLTTNNNIKNSEKITFQSSGDLVNKSIDSLFNPLDICSGFGELELDFITSDTVPIKFAGGLENNPDVLFSNVPSKVDAEKAIPKLSDIQNQKPNESSIPVQKDIPSESGNQIGLDPSEKATEVKESIQIKYRERLISPPGLGRSKSSQDAKKKKKSSTEIKSDVETTAKVSQSVNSLTAELQEKLKEALANKVSSIQRHDSAPKSFRGGSPSRPPLPDQFSYDEEDNLSSSSLHSSFSLNTFNDISVTLGKGIKTTSNHHSQSNSPQFEGKEEKEYTSLSNLMRGKSSKYEAEPSKPVLQAYNKTDTKKKEGIPKSETKEKLQPIQTRFNTMGVGGLSELKPSRSKERVEEIFKEGKARVSVGKEEQKEAKQMKMTTTMDERFKKQLQNFFPKDANQSLFSKAPDLNLTDPTTITRPLSTFRESVIQEIPQELVVHDQFNQNFVVSIQNMRTVKDLLDYGRDELGLKEPFELFKVSRPDKIASGTGGGLIYLDKNIEIKFLLSHYVGKNVVLQFQPTDESRIWMIEVCFSQHLKVNVYVDMMTTCADVLESVALCRTLPLQQVISTWCIYRHDKIENKEELLPHESTPFEPFHDGSTYLLKCNVNFEKQMKNEALTTIKLKQRNASEINLPKWSSTSSEVDSAVEHKKSVPILNSNISPESTEKKNAFQKFIGEKKNLIKDGIKKSLGREKTMSETNLEGCGVSPEHVVKKGGSETMLYTGDQLGELGPKSPQDSSRRLPGPSRLIGFLGKRKSSANQSSFQEGHGREEKLKSPILGSPKEQEFRNIPGTFVLTIFTDHHENCEVLSVPLHIKCKNVKAKLCSKYGIIEESDEYQIVEVLDGVEKVVNEESQLFNILAGWREQEKFVFKKAVLAEPTPMSSEHPSPLANMMVQLQKPVPTDENPKYIPVHHVDREGFLDVVYNYTTLCGLHWCSLQHDTLMVSKQKGGPEGNMIQSKLLMKGARVANYPHNELSFTVATQGTVWRFTGVNLQDVEAWKEILKKTAEATGEEAELTFRDFTWSHAKFSFGKVMMCREQNTGLAGMVRVVHRYCQPRYEKLYKSSSFIQVLPRPFMSHLQYAFITDKLIYLITFEMPAGDMYFYLRRQKSFSRPQAQFYFVEILSAIKELHEQGYVYGNLQQENIFIDSSGHIRLFEFGCYLKSPSTLDMNSQLSIAYLSPEVIENQQYGIPLDMWCLGILLYEMLTGSHPFAAADETEQRRKICTEQPPPHRMIGSDAFHIIVKLLEKNPSARYTINDILKDPFVEGVDFEKVKNKTMTPYFVPDENRMSRIM